MVVVSSVSYHCVKMSEETREEIVSELRAYKVANPNWITDVEMAKVVASYNNRLASMSPAVQASCESHVVLFRARYFHRIFYISVFYFSFEEFI